MSEKTKSLTIGIFVIAALCFLGWMLLFLKPTVGDGKQILTVRFSSIDKITVGTRVTYAGKPVGEVISVNEVWESPDVQEKEKDGFFLYELKLAIDSSVPVYSTDEIAVKTLGLFGEKAITITPKPRRPGKSVKIYKGDVTYAQSMDPLEGTVNQVYELSTKMGKALDLIIELIESNEESVDSFSKSFNRLTYNLSKTLEAINSTDFFNSLGKASEGINDISKELTVLLGELNSEHFGDSLGKLTNHMSSISASLDDPNAIADIVQNFTLLSEDLLSLHSSFEALAETSKSFERTSDLVYTLTDNLSHGKGSLGKFLTDDRFYLQTESLIGKAQVLMNDINHYGLLFHNDQNWQRERAKRINFLTNIETPKEFQNYFEEEIGSIQTSFARITKVIDALQGVPLQKVSREKAFQKGFLELLRQVELLQDQLKQYNKEMLHAD